MTVTIEELDSLPRDAAIELLTSCCGSRKWTAAMVARRPFGTRDALLRAADEEWNRLEPNDWLEALGYSPPGETHPPEPRADPQPVLALAA